HSFRQDIPRGCLGAVTHDPEFSCFWIIYCKSVPRTTIPDVVDLFLKSGGMHSNLAGQLWSNLYRSVVTPIPVFSESSDTVILPKGESTSRLYLLFLELIFLLTHRQFPG